MIFHFSLFRSRNVRLSSFRLPAPSEVLACSEIGRKNEPLEFEVLWREKESERETEFIVLDCEFQSAGILTEDMTRTVYETIEIRSDSEVLYGKIERLTVSSFAGV